jgi:hypothetical protein
MSDWADESRDIAHYHVDCCAYSDTGNPHSLQCDRLTDAIATALRAAERKGLERAVKVVKDHIGGRTALMSAIQSLIDKPETEERR